MKWLDAPYYELLDQFMNLFWYFREKAWAIGRIVMGYNVCMILIKYAVKGQGLRDELVKIGIAFMSFWLLFNAYPKIITGFNTIIVRWSNGSTNEQVYQMINKVRDNYDFWAKKGDKADESYSDIIKVVKEDIGGGNIAQRYILDITGKYGFLRPNAIMRVVMLTFENMLNRSAKFAITGKQWVNKMVTFIAAIAMMICCILAAMQYFITTLEFAIITSVGVILLPFMLWDGSKFLTEKLVGAIVGFVIKMLFVSVAMMLTINGFLSLMVRNYEGAIDQTIYVIFVSIFYMMICQNGPKLAVSLLTGSPQMSLGEGMAAIGAYAGAALAGKMAAVGAVKATRATAGGLAKGYTKAGGALSQAKGASEAAKELGGGRGTQIAAGARSLATSAGMGMRSMAHQLGRSLVSGSPRGGSYGNSGTNRFSSSAKLNAPNADGHSKTLKEYFAEKKTEGQNIGLNHMVNKEEIAKEKALRKSMPYDGKTLGKNIAAIDCYRSVDSFNNKPEKSMANISGSTSKSDQSTNSNKNIDGNNDA